MASNGSAELGEPKKLWTAVFTMRSEKIRIISVCRARQDEGEQPCEGLRALKEEHHTEGTEVTEVS